MFTFEFKKSLGKELEDNLLDYIKRREGYKKSFREASEREDLFEGTDFFLDDIRFDVTFNPEKDHVNWSGEVIDLNFAGLKVQTGVRTANKTCAFEEPVCVIAICGVADNALLRQYMENVIDSIGHHLDDIIGSALDCYFAYCE